MENILPYLTIALLYVLCDPSVTAAKVLLGIGVAARILHTIVYGIFVLPQPTRSICFATHLSIQLYMTIKIIVHFCC